MIHFTFLFAQIPPVDSDDALERYLDTGSDRNDLRSESEELEYFRSHPIDVSHPVYSELIRLPMISPMTAESIILLSDTVNITDAEQLRSAGLMNDILFEQIKPFITVNIGRESKDWSTFLPGSVELRTRMEKRIAKSEGYSQGKYLGSAQSVYQRMKIRGEHSEAAILFEKDPGELSSDGFMSGSVSLKDIDPIHRIIIGDFSFSADQGLVFAKNISSAKGNNVINQTRKRGRVIAPNTSADELHFFRGSAIETSVNGLQFNCFYSQRELPASVDPNGGISALYSSGLFRNETELKKRNVMGERTFGSRAEMDLNTNDLVSMSLLNVHYSRPFMNDSSKNDRKQSLTAGSLAYDISEGPYSFFGEAAMNDQRRYGYSGGVIMQLSRSVSVCCHYHSYETGYYTPFAHPFGERNTLGDGEHGQYIGLAFTQGHYSLNMYYERTVFPTIGGEYSANGTESFFSIEVPVTKRCELYLHTRRSIRSQFAVDERIQSNYRGELRLKVSRNILLTNRIEWTNVSYRSNVQKMNGLLIFTDGAYRDMKNGIRLRSRLILFDSPFYESRLYQFESDVAGNYSNPPLYGQGIRLYIVFGYELFSDMVCSFKYSVTKKLHVVSMGSGDDTIIGNSDGQLALQLDFRM
ncbi:MAG: hypothetical protein ACOYNS_10265 [Bacteroidota bacterium]